jgi:signal transduction histidine kinase
LGAVVVTASLGPYERSASTALGASVLLGLLTLVAIAGLARWLINRALRPVSEMTTKAADWDERDLSRRFFAGEPRDELSTLASVFDRLLARLAQSLRREQRLTAEVSHELRTPLAKILAEAELAASRERDPQDYRVSLRSITNYAQALQRVLETLLASARAAAPASATDSNPLLVARRVAASLQETLTARGKSIDVVGTSRARAAVDADVLERILAPLLENAARHAERHISLEVRTEGDVAIIEIADDGSGVARADRERIFDPGVRGHASADSAHAGAGLGLALARRLARAAGGDVEARAQSGGGRFVTSLPLSR